MTRCGGAGGGEADVDLVVGALACFGAARVGEPAAVDVVGEHPGQRRQAVVEEGTGTRYAAQHPDRRDMGHASGEEQEGLPVGKGPPVDIEPVEPAAVANGVAVEPDQSGELSVEPRAVAGEIGPGRGGGSHPAHATHTRVPREATAAGRRTRGAGAAGSARTAVREPA